MAEATITGSCQRGHHGSCGGVMRTGTGWNWWCTCHCHPEPTLADAAPDSGAEKAIAFWRAHRTPDQATPDSGSNATGDVQ